MCSTCQLAICHHVLYLSLVKLANNKLAKVFIFLSWRSPWRTLKIKSQIIGRWVELGRKFLSGSFFFFVSTSLHCFYGKLFCYIYICFYPSTDCINSYRKVILIKSSSFSIWGSCFILFELIISTDFHELENNLMFLSST